MQEHLEFYCRLRGIPDEHISTAVQQAALDVELDGDQLLQTAGVLSGGQKRRLSLGISLIGDPKVLFLDEPTTGLDPDSKTSIHRIVARARLNRSIILTTHSMEEADTLCTRIGIMKQGRMQALGNQLRLKNRYGDGFQMVLSLQNPDIDITSLELFLKENIYESARLQFRHGKIVQYVLPVADVSVL